jgi:predicted CopG family antitoxin
MKTISLTESAYQRLASWKEGRTFSQVIERMIPPKGTIEAAFEAVGNLPELSAADFEELEKAVHAGRQKLPAAWS